MASTPSTTQIDYRPDIDGLRAVAVLSVVFCHAGFGLPGGYVGVDIFFVISGFLITSLILKEVRNGSFSLTRFWERRIRRIAPALVVVTAFTLMAGWFLLLPPAYDRLGASATYLVLLVSNFNFLNTGDYFAPKASEMPLLHTWSLAVEEQFYLLLPMALVILARVKRPDRTTPVLAAVAAISLAVAVYGVQAWRTHAFYLLPGRTWELLVGSLLAMASPIRSAAMRQSMAALSLPLILIPCFAYQRDTPFPGLAAVPPVLGAVLVIWSGMTEQPRPLVGQLLASRPMVFIGLISYSLYLWHWPPLALYHATIPGEPSATVRLVLVTASLAMAVLSWRFVEVPFRKGKLLPERRGLMLCSGLTALPLLILGIVIDRADGYPERIPPQARKFLATARSDPRFQRSISPERVPMDLTRLGPPHSPRLLVWGDSHAMCLLPGIDVLCDEYEIAGLAATRSSTIPVLDYRLKSVTDGREKHFNDAVFEYLREGNITTVVLVGRWAGYCADPRFPPALLVTVERLKALGLRIFVVEDVPDYRCSVPETLAQLVWRGNDPAGIARFRNDYRRDNAVFLTLIPKLEQLGATILRPGGALDLANNGLPFDAEGSFYTDTQHLSVHGAMRARSALQQAVRRTQADR